MTRPDHQSGTDRIAEVTDRCNLEAVVNIQGDEPMIDPDVIDKVADLINKNEMSTAATPIKLPENLKNPNCGLHGALWDCKERYPPDSRISRFRQKQFKNF